jgi:hypothetical protein
MVTFTPGEGALCTDRVAAVGGPRRSVREQKNPCSYQECKPSHKVRILVNALTKLSRLAVTVSGCLSLCPAVCHRVRLAVTVSDWLSLCMFKLKVL